VEILRSVSVVVVALRVGVVWVTFEIVFMMVVLGLLLEIDDFDSGGRWAGAYLATRRDGRILSLLKAGGLGAVRHTKAALARGMIIGLSNPGVEGAGSR
jgi:hypothetical protein